MPVILALGVGERQENLKFKASLDYIERSRPV
jgi:hypothetical protein